MKTTPRTRTTRLMAGLFLVGLAWSSPCKAAPAPSRTFGDMVGLNIKYSQGEPQSDLPLLKELGVKWVRDNVGWPEIEPAARNYAEFPQAFRDRLSFYKQNNIGVVFLLAYENAKAYPATPENPLNPLNPQAFGGYAAQVARGLKASGVRFVLEIWNEPHNFTIQKMAGGEWNGKLPSPWVDHYLQMAQQAVSQVKLVDPQIRLLSDDDMWIIHPWYLEKGVPAALDGFGFHPYWGESSGPEMTAVSQETGWAKPFTLVDADRSFHSAVRRLREQGQIKMGKTPALWATEWGQPVDGKAPYSLLTPDGKSTADSVAAGIPRAFISAADAGVEVVCWFSSYDSVDGAMGLRSNDGKRRPSFNAFKTMTQQLGAYVLAKHLIGADHRTSGVQAYLFRSPQNSKIVMWNIDGEAPFVVNETVRNPIRIVDVQGRDVPRKIVNGRLQLTLSQSPIYISGLPDEVSLQAAPPAVATKPVYFFP